MTKKDYEIIAEALRAARPDPNQYAKKNQWLIGVVALSVALEKDNPRFDWKRFCDYCES